MGKTKRREVRMAVLLWGVLFLIPLLFSACTGRSDAVPNPSFERIEGGMPKDWHTRTFRREASFELADNTARTGSHSVRISSEEGADAAWTTIVPVIPFSRYRLTGWIKTEGLEAGTGRGAFLNLHGMGRTWTEPVTGTQDWTQVSLEFDTEGIDAVQINCLFGGWGQSTGTAWYDDIELEMLETRPVKPEVTLDTASRGEPISPYIFGQFIEHLGRCIYGGIWAEMLEDRKFFYPLDDENTPWKIMAGTGVTMDGEDAFVGAHTPVFTVDGSGGISQEGLALISGKSYTGRIVLAAQGGISSIQVNLVAETEDGSGQTISLEALEPGYRTYPLEFTAETGGSNARLEIVGKGTGSFRVGTVSLMPADNIEGFRPDVLILLRELDSPVYRWPGGNFVSGYDWKDGIGDRDRRPPRKNPAWKGIEHNDVGIDEFMDLCRLIETEPFIAVNSGLGDVTSAVEEVEYVNGAASTPMGKWRAENGHPEPYGCRWWSIGNEMYGSWQLGHMPLSDYVKKHNEFAEAMRKADPSIRLIAVGAVGRWSETMMAECADHMELISEHFYCQEAPGLMGHISQIPRNVRRIAEAHREYRKTIPALEGKDIRIALDEWNFWYGPHIYGELGVRYFLKDALGIAAGLHEYFRQSDMIFMANYAQTVNVIGAIKASRTDAALATTGLVLKLYRQKYGEIPIEVSGRPAPLDVAAAWREAGRILTVAIVNPTDSIQRLDLELQGIDFPDSARCWRISGDDPMAYNEPGKPAAVSIQEMGIIPVSKKMDIPPLSVSLYELEIQQPH